MSYSAHNGFEGFTFETPNRDWPRIPLMDVSTRKTLDGLRIPPYRSQRKASIPFLCDRELVAWQEEATAKGNTALLAALEGEKAARKDEPAACRLFRFSVACHHAMLQAGKAYDEATNRQKRGRNPDRMGEFLATEGWGWEDYISFDELAMITVSKRRSARYVVSLFDGELADSIVEHEAEVAILEARQGEEDVSVPMFIAKRTLAVLKKERHRRLQETDRDVLARVLGRLAIAVDEENRTAILFTPGDMIRARRSKNKWKDD